MQETVVQRLLSARNVVIDQAPLVQAALDLRLADIADRIIPLTGQSHGCTKTLTFDQKFAHIDGVELLA